MNIPTKHSARFSIRSGISMDRVLVLVLVLVSYPFAYPFACPFACPFAFSSAIKIDATTTNPTEWPTPQRIPYSAARRLLGALALSVAIAER